MTRELPAITERERRPAPAPTPQALAWHDGSLWIGSRDLRRIYRIDAKAWTVSEEMAAPGIPWAAVSTGDSLHFTIGEGPDDDRYIRRFVVGRGFPENERTPCPEFTGSYLSYDGANLYLSQWYKHRIVKFDSAGNILREIPIGAEICGHVFVDGSIYVLRGTERGNENWRIARLNPQEATPQIEDLARVPFQCRSLTFDGKHFWANHRVAGETVSFDLPR
jgi:hypothetical protein